MYCPRCVRTGCRRRSHVRRNKVVCHAGRNLVRAHRQSRPRATVLARRARFEMDCRRTRAAEHLRKPTAILRLCPPLTL